MKTLMVSSLIIVSLLNAFAVKAQDPQFSNFYLTTLYTNPAFTGRSGAQYLVNMDARRQWHQIGAFDTFYASGDYALGRLGLGLSLYADQAGSTPLTTFGGSFSFSYGRNITNKADLVIGFQSNFYDQYLRQDYILIDDYLNNTPNPVSPGIHNQYVNLSAGLLLIHETFWIGISLKDFLPNPLLHNSNDYSLVSSGRNSGSYYGKFSVHGGYYHFLLPKRVLFTSFFNYRNRGRIRQFEGGAVLAYKPSFKHSGTSDVVLGIGSSYRGLVPTHGGLSTRDAAIFQAYLSLPQGIKTSNTYLKSIFQMVYSYDMTVSRLSTTGGTHEITIVLKFSNGNPQSSWPETERERKHVRDPCDFTR